MVGCNYGSKNTLDHTYISAAKHEGADIRTLCEVRSFAPAPEGAGYVVDYVQHDLDRAGKKTNTKELQSTQISAERLVLCAGSLGTTFLLLKNRGAFPHISQKLGHRFSGNGDFLGFAVDARQDDASSGTTQPRDFSPTVGPVITSTIRVNDAVDGSHCAADGGSSRGFFIQEAGFPTFVTWTLAATGVSGLVRRAIKTILYRIADRFNYKFDSDLSAEISVILGDESGFESAIPLLGMGRDVPDGVMRLRNGYLENDWTIGTSQAFFTDVRSTMRDMAQVWQAKYVDNPTYHLKRVITVHPLGGCPMGTDIENGVVDEYGEVFGYPGLYVADGSVMPGPTGSNPSLTIAAFANRCADRILSSDVKTE
jgi:cholesterol oxidase